MWFFWLLETKTSEADKRTLFSKKIYKLVISLIRQNSKELAETDGPNLVFEIPANEGISYQYFLQCYSLFEYIFPFFSFFSFILFLNSIFRYTIYMPDFFIIFFFTMLIILSCILDLFIVVLMLISEASLALRIFFIISAYLRVIFEVLVKREGERSLNRTKKAFLELLLSILLTLLGLHAVVISAQILQDTLEASNNSKQSSGCTTHPVFHISHENLFFMKIYCYIYLGIKSIPQLFIVSIFIVQNHVSGITAYLSTLNIVLNMVLFAFTMSVSFPIRKRPGVYINFSCLLLSATNKFLGTLCGCCANLTVFVSVFRNVECFAFLTHFAKTLIWVFPCQSLLSNQPVPLSKLQFVTYWIFFPVIFSFIFIHPFEKTWRLHYYFSYFLNGFMDLAFLGLCTDTQLSDLSCYCILRIVQIGFLSCFGLLNSFTRKKNCEFREKITPNENEDIEKPQGEKPQDSEVNSSEGTENEENTSSEDIRKSESEEQEKTSTSNSLSVV